MVDTSISPEDINRLFRTGVITYFMPSGKTYMKTIGKQSIEAYNEDKEDKESYEPEDCTIEYVHHFRTKNALNMDSGCSTPLAEILDTNNKC